MYFTCLYLNNFLDNTKTWNDVTFWFSKMIFYEQQEQYVLTTVKEIKYFFCENAGKQCVTMSLTVVIYHHLEDINFWTSSTLNNILTIGNNLYMYI